MNSKRREYIQGLEAMVTELNDNSDAWRNAQNELAIVGLEDQIEALKKENDMLKHSIREDARAAKRMLAEAQEDSECRKGAWLIRTECKFIINRQEIMAP